MFLEIAGDTAYTLTDSNDHNFYVEDYAPSSYRNIGDQTVVPVYIKPYRKSNGQFSYTICIKKIRNTWRIILIPDLQFR